MASCKITNIYGTGNRKRERGRFAVLLELNPVISRQENLQKRSCQSRCQQQQRKYRSFDVHRSPSRFLAKILRSARRLNYTVSMEYDSIPSILYGIASISQNHSSRGRAGPTIQQTDPANTSSNLRYRIIFSRFWNYVATF